jgi:hypothetical protein
MVLAAWAGHAARICWGSTLQAERWRVKFPVSIGVFELT